MLWCWESSGTEILPGTHAAAPRWSRRQWKLQRFRNIYSAQHNIISLARERRDEMRNPLSGCALIEVHCDRSSAMGMQSHHVAAELLFQYNFLFNICVLFLKVFNFFVVANPLLHCRLYFVCLRNLMQNLVRILNFQSISSPPVKVRWLMILFCCHTISKKIALYVIFIKKLALEFFMFAIVNSAINWLVT